MSTSRARPKPPPANGGTPRHAGMGVASFVIAVAGVVSAAMMVVVAAALAKTPGADASEGTPFSYVLGAWIFGTGLLCLVGIVFGIGGVFQKQRRRGLAVAGLLMNIAMPIGLMFVLVLAFTFEHRSSKSPTAPRGGAATYAARHVTGPRGDAVVFTSTKTAERPPAVRYAWHAILVACGVGIFVLASRRWIGDAKAEAPKAAGPSLPPPLPPLPAHSNVRDKPATRTRVCGTCNKTVPSEAAFCRRCGHTLSDGSAVGPSLPIAARAAR